MAANDEYYYAAGDEQRGPVPVADLPGLGVRAGTLVWREGMGDWVRADKVPEVAAALAAAEARKAAAAVGPYGVAASQPFVAAPAPQYAPPPAAYGAPQPCAPPPAYAAPAFPTAAAQAPIGYAGAPGYGAPAYGAYGGGYGAANQPPGHGQCLASMILGIVALVTTCFYGLGLFVGIVGVVFGHIGQTTHRRATGRSNGMATAGLICGYLAIGLTLLAVAAVIVAMAGAG